MTNLAKLPHHAATVANVYGVIYFPLIIDTSVDVIIVIDTLSDPMNVYCVDRVDGFPMVLKLILEKRQQALRPEDLSTKDVKDRLLKQRIQNDPVERQKQIKSKF